MATMTAMAPSHDPSHQVPLNQSSLNGFPVASQNDHSSATTSEHEDTVHRGPVTVTLNFYDPPSDGSDPFNYVEKPPVGVPQRNFGDSPQSVRLNDARGKESDFELNTHAFATLTGHPHNDKIDWNSDNSITSVYYPEVEKILLENVPGAQRILLFDHTVRRAKPDAHRMPVTRVHIDQTPKSAAARVTHHLPEEQEKLLAGRYRIINVWRPINGAVETFPLAFASSATVPDTDMVGVEHKYPDRSGETAAVRYNEDHQWWYWSGVDNNERILLQCFDSKKPMNRVPHSAFVDPRTGKGAKGRESIEVRALVFG